MSNHGPGIDIIGIDCATEPRDIGLACGNYSNSHLVVTQARKIAKNETVADVICRWIRKGIPCLLAIDAPLGWPAELGEELSRHTAGARVVTDPNMMFRRETDRRVKQITGKTALDVGADRIARSAHAALELLEALRKKTGKNIPLAWDNHLKDNISAIEVYPAATLKMTGLISTGYKKPENTKERKDIIFGLEQYLRLDVDKTILENDDDILDATVCLLAGADFLNGKAVRPDNMGTAIKEGWIWVKGQ
ncbi:MAG: DUF429 domain-containing protein [Gammaproteobacteria bacterium]|nr:DUF429 domain-containing protein [Gammaproteobacteria bacterium]MDH5653181.1 DUF429 domain-containing protein [Gammaproteobacteria bacterium]